MIIRIKQILLAVGDIAFLYICLFIALLIRYEHINGFLLNAHLGPFSVIFIIWIASFYITGLYDIHELKNSYRLIERILISTFFAFMFSVAAFYLVPYFKISPKTNLAIFTVVSWITFIGWRWFFNLVYSTPQKKIMILGKSKENQELAQFIFQNPHIGYKVEFYIEDENPEDLEKTIGEKKINLIILDPNQNHAQSIFENIYKKISSGIEILDSHSAYESIFRKSPLEEIQKLWLIAPLSRSRKIYEFIKRPAEIFSSGLLFILLLPIFFLISLLIKITSSGPVIYKQKRVGKKDKLFTLYKFRTMIDGAEKQGPQWAGKNDPRITALGKILRFTHLDEIPQLINIIKGNLSFVGPRPERPEFVEELRKKIPYYEFRHIIRPGLSGWAQINYRYGASIEDSSQKLQFDIYYIKHRSLALDFLIMLKTIKMFIFNHS